jgi:hypothetical protein
LGERIVVGPRKALAKAVEVRMKVRLPLVLCIAFFGSAPLVAVDESIFFDDFEAGDHCAWTSISPAIAPISELEAPDRSSNENDAQEDAELISRCAIVDGVSGPVIADPPDGDVADFDTYKLVMTGPVLLRTTLTRGTGGTSEFQPGGDVNDDDGGTLELGFLPLAADSITTTRQFWIPSSGTWFVRVYDARNYNDPTVGDTDQTYRLTLDVEPVSGTKLFTTLSAEPLTIPADGSVVIYELDGDTVGTLDYVETFAERLTSPSLPIADTKLYLVRPVDGAWTTVAENDDFDIYLDSRIPDDEKDPGILLGSGPYFVIVDFYDIFDDATFDVESPPAEFELDLQYVSVGL